MTNQHPITPPPELRRQWLDNDDFPFVAGTNDLLSIAKDRLNSVMDQAAQWGADQELEACCEWLREFHQSKRPGGTENLRRSRRPKPPSLKEQALEQLRRVNAVLQFQATGGETSVIRRALEALDD